MSKNGSESGAGTVSVGASGMTSATGDAAGTSVTYSVVSVEYSSAVSLSSLLHYKKIGVAELKQQLAARGVEVRL